MRFFKIATDDIQEAAHRAGYTTGPVFHGSASGGVNVFNPSKTGTVQRSDWGRGIYFTPSRGQAEGYRISAVQTLDEEAHRLWEDMEQKAKEYGTTGMMKSIDYKAGRITPDQYREIKEMEDHWRQVYVALEKTEKGQVYPSYLMIRKPYVYRYVGITDPYLGDLARERGCDAVAVTSEEANTSGPIEDWAEEILVFKSNQIKSAAPVTYDDVGNPIPLEQRFDPSKPDIRY